MHSYNHRLKEQSSQKHVFNTFHTCIVPPDTMVCVIDGENHCSATSMSTAIRAKNIVIVNTDPDIIKTAREKGFSGICDLSTRAY